MIHIIDAVMGAGKTESAINYINENKSNKHFIYVTPYLEEVARIKERCGFHEPIKLNNAAPKIIDFKNALRAQKNIVTTHSLFSLFDDEIVDICQAYKYELIMDEVHDVVDVLNISRHDMDILLNECVTVEDDGLLKWREDRADYEGNFSNYKLMCDNGALGYYSNTAMVWLFPVKLFEAFKDTYILTYMFDSQIQRCYYDYYGLKYDYMYITPDRHFTMEKQTYKTPYNYLDLIKLVENRSLIDIGLSEHALSKQWYRRNASGLVKQVKRNLNSFFRKHKTLYTDNGYVVCGSKDCIWTTFSDYSAGLIGDVYGKGYIPCNMKATNAYMSRTVVAYTINRYVNPIVVNFFKQHDIEISDDDFATSEMIQFIWRSGIRDGKRITLYIMSNRMMLLLVQWLGAVYSMDIKDIYEKIKLTVEDYRK